MEMNIWISLLSFFANFIPALGRIHVIKQRDSCLQAHNFLRAFHTNTGPLVWDDSLAKSADKWAVKMAFQGKLMLDLKNANRFGENVEVYNGVKPPPCEEIVFNWYKTGKSVNYDPALLNQGGNQVHKFTQLIWKGTTSLGMGIAYDDVSKRTFISARYSPPGNYLGLYYDNVKKLKPGKSAPTLKELRGSMSLVVTKKPVTTPAPRICRDTAPNCFGLLYYCSNPVVQQHCPKSCGLC